MKRQLTCLLSAICAVHAIAAFDPIVPFSTNELDVDVLCRELRGIRQKTGLRRFFVTGPGFNGVMYGPFADDLYAGIGRRIAALREGLVDTDIELNWWCSPSIRYFSDFPSIEDHKGNRSKDNKKCPLDPAFAADFCAKIRSVALARPKMICIEDDYTLSWGRGLGSSGACFCPRHMESFAAHYGKALPPGEIQAAFERRTPANEPIRRAFAATVRDSLVGLARQVRATVDSVDPSIRICLCDTGVCAERDGDALEAMVRAFAGATRPAVRPHGSIYGAETTPASIPGAISHAQFVLERLPDDIETFYESDSYPHNRFYTSAAQLLSLMTGAVAMGTDDFLFYCLQYLDDPLEDTGYADAYRALRPRLERLRTFIRERRAHLAGVRVCWSGRAMALTRGCGGEMRDILRSGAYLLSKMSLPYTMREDAGGPTLLIGAMPEVMSDDELRTVLSGGVLLDAPAADLVAKRGFGDLLGTDVEMFTNRPPIIRERILPAAGCVRAGKLVNAFYVFVAGTEGTVRSFARLSPRAGTEVWSEFTDAKQELIVPSMTFAKNRLGGRVAVLATSLVGNRSSGLYNLRKQELLNNLFRRMGADALPVSADGVPGIWLLPNVSADGREMMVMVNNLSGDVRRDVRLNLGSSWRGATVSRLAPDGTPQPLITNHQPLITLPFALGQMEPEFLLVTADH